MGLQRASGYQAKDLGKERPGPLGRAEPEQGGRRKANQCSAAPGFAPILAPCFPCPSLPFSIEVAHARRRYAHGVCVLGRVTITTARIAILIGLVSALGAAGPAVAFDFFGLWSNETYAARGLGAGNSLPC